MKFSISQIKTCVLDFDDVVVRGSEQIKDQAWKEVFKDLLDLEIQQRWQSHFANGRGNRFDIIRETIAEINQNNPKSELSLEKLSFDFDHFVQEKLQETGVAKEDQEALVWLGKHFKMYINSATPQKELELTVASLRIEGNFDGVMGHSSTVSKFENLEKVALLSGAEPREILFVGDSDGDMGAAEAFGCNFVGVSTGRNDWKRLKPDLCLIENLSALPRLFF